MKLERRLMMNKSKIITISLILLLLVVIWLIASLTIGKNKGLTNPLLGKPASQTIQPSATPTYNPPKEIKYDGNSNLKEELEAINPEVLDEDFAGL